jgi:hypothetical protein
VSVVEMLCCHTHDKCLVWTRVFFTQNHIKTKLRRRLNTNNLVSFRMDLALNSLTFRKFSPALLKWKNKCLRKHFSLWYCPQNMLQVDWLKLLECISVRNKVCYLEVLPVLSMNICVRSNLLST